MVSLMAESYVTVLISCVPTFTMWLNIRAADLFNYCLLK